MASDRMPWPRLIIAALVTIVALIFLLRPAQNSTALTRPGSAAPASRTTTTVPLVLPPADVGSLPQTTAEPSATTAVFAGEMQALWKAIQTGDPTAAKPAYFPKPAYLQVKALRYDASDYSNRLVAHFALDITAAHELLGAQAGSARLVETLVPSGHIRWIPPGSYLNNLGYWFVPGARLVYEEGGHERSLGIASLISWRGYWYVVHLGSLSPAGQGVVDGPSAGIGSFGSPDGC